MSRYDGPIVDAHQHFWKPSEGRNPWLLPDAMIPFRYGDYSAIKRDYLPADYLADASGFDIAAIVYVETEWDRDDPLGEIDFVETLRHEADLPTAVVGHAELRDPAVAEVLERLAGRPLVRGIRDKPGQAPTPGERFDSPSLMTDPRWIDGYSMLGRHGLLFELQVAWWHLHEAATLARRFPQTVLVVDHAALPADRSAAGLAGWRRALRAVSPLENVVVKVSGIGIPGTPWLVANNRVVVETIADLFGPDRMMFASNFPVDGLCGSFADVYGGFVDITSDWSLADQRAAFAGTAMRVYRLPPDTAHPDGTS